MRDCERVMLVLINFWKRDTAIDISGAITISTSVSNQSIQIIATNELTNVSSAMMSCGSETLTASLMTWRSLLKRAISSPGRQRSKLSSGRRSSRS